MLSRKFASSLDFSDDRLRRGGPYKRLRMTVGVDVVIDFRAQFLHTAERSAADGDKPSC